MVLLGCILLVLTGCGGSSSHSSSATPTPTPSPTATPPPTPTPVQLGAAVAEKGLTDILQWIPAEDEDDEAFPGSGNVWDLNEDFSLDDGDDDQFDDALVLSVGIEGSYEDFPYLTYADLTWYTPEFTDLLDAVRLLDSTSSWSPLTGNYSAIIAPGIDNRLSQIVDLRNASGPVTLTASLDYSSDDGTNLYLPEDMARIAIRGLDGALLSEGSASPIDLSDYVGEQVVVSFELTSQGYGYFIVDDVSVTDDDSTEYIVDGDFESGDLNAWTVFSAPVYQNITTAAQTVNGLTVTRSFYTAPGSLWGRWVDVFTNETDAAITASIEYYSNLGSDYYGIIYETPGTEARALTSWDGYTGDRDVGFAFGTGATLDYLSDPSLGDGDGSDDIYFSYEVTVEPGQSVAIANFIVMSAIDTGETAVDVSATADEVDTALQGIINNFWSDVTYRHGMTQAQIDALINFEQ
jgi:hypothetical protein